RTASSTRDGDGADYLAIVDDAQPTGQGGEHGIVPVRGPAMPLLPLSVPEVHDAVGIHFENGGAVGFAMCGFHEPRGTAVHAGAGDQLAGAVDHNDGYAPVLLAGVINHRVDDPLGIVEP